MALQAFTKTCAKHTPGNSRLGLFDIKEVATCAITAGELTELTLNDAADIVEIDIDRDNLVVNSEGVGTKGGVNYVTQSVEFSIAKVNTDAIKTINSLADHSACGLGAIVYTNNKVWLVAGMNINADGDAAEGIHGMFLASANGSTGSDQTAEDGDMYSVRLEGVLPDHIIPVNPDQVVDLTVATVVAEEE